MTEEIAGKCRYCKCHADCPMGNGDTCGWLGAARTVCTNYACVRKHYADQDRERFLRKQLNRKRTPAEVHALIAGRKRSAKKRAPSGRIA